MKYIIVLAVFFSSLANAELTSYSSIIHLGDDIDTVIGAEQTVTVKNNSESYAVEELTVTMTGNSSQFTWTDCPSTTLGKGDECSVVVRLLPGARPGKKMRKLNFDGYENREGGITNEVSLTLPVVGFVPPDNKP